MRSPIRIFRDDAGVPRAVWQDAPVRAEYLLRFLESDLSADAALIAKILSDSRAVAGGKSKAVRVGGNAFTLKLAPKTASLYPNFDDAAKPFSLPLADFLKVVQRWDKLVRT